MKSRGTPTPGELGTTVTTAGNAEAREENGHPRVKTVVRLTGDRVDFDAGAAQIDNWQIPAESEKNKFANRRGWAVALNGTVPLGGVATRESSVMRETRCKRCVLCKHLCNQCH